MRWGLLVRAKRTRRAMQPGSATSELAIPGLETPEIVTQERPGHWIERGPQKRLMVFAGRSHMTLAQRIAEHLGVELREIELHPFGYGETDVRLHEAVRGAETMDADFAIMHKTRPAHGIVSVTEVTGRVRDKVAIIGDDITTTGGTLIAGAHALKEHGATDVYVFVTHALLSREGLEKLSEADLAGIVVTDTVPIDPIAKPAHMTGLTVAPLLAETIMNVLADHSVSAIFGGENQLF